MYKEYYKLREDPFNITPDPRFIYLTRHHREALNHMLYGVCRRKGFICLTGEVGSGKTMLCRALLNGLDSRFRTALVLNPMLNENQLLRAILAEFGIKTARRDRLEYLKLLNSFLLEINSSGGDAVLIIDEAQDMSTKALELVRLLSNLETDRQKLLQIVLVGQPELREKLASHELRQLAQRITVRFHLRNMTREEVEGYLRHRLTVAGQADEGVIRFDSRAVRQIHNLSRGIPRLVNAIGDKALLAGYVYRTGVINKRIIRLVIRELKEAC